MPLLHARLHLGEAGEAFHCCGLEADEFEKRFAIGEVAVEAFFERTVIFGDELQILLGRVGCDVLQLGKNLLNAGGADACEDAILLQDFAADVERKVFAVDNAAHEAQILRQELSRSRP